jgi:hypothetical protein
MSLHRHKVFCFSRNFSPGRVCTECNNILIFISYYTVLIAGVIHNNLYFNCNITRQVAGKTGAFFGETSNKNEKPPFHFN